MRFAWPFVFVVVTTALTGCASTGGDSGESPGAGIDSADAAPEWADEQLLALLGDAAAMLDGVESEDLDEVICRREHVVGTHFKREVCLTRREMMEQESDGTARLMRAQRMMAAMRAFHQQTGGGVSRGPRTGRAGACGL